MKNETVRGEAKKFSTHFLSHDVGCCDGNNRKASFFCVDAGGVGICKRRRFVMNVIHQQRRCWFSRFATWRLAGDCAGCSTETSQACFHVESFASSTPQMSPSTVNQPQIDIQLWKSSWLERERNQQAFVTFSSANSINVVHRFTAAFFPCSCFN